MPQIKAISFIADNTKPDSKPNEDFLVVLPIEGIAVVADGATRSYYASGVYPECSALLAAKTFCNLTADQLRMGKSLNESFERANREIAEINRGLGIVPKTCDYLKNDYLSCSGIAGMLSREDLHLLTYGSIGNCRVLVYDRNFFPVYISENPVAILEQFRDNWRFDSKKDVHLFWREILRNHPGERYITYGALTGEPEAMRYMRTNTVELKDGDTIVFCTDGIWPFLCSKMFRWFIAFSLSRDNPRIEEDTKHYLSMLTPKLAAQGIQNLDDDKAFVAFSFSA